MDKEEFLKILEDFEKRINDGFKKGIETISENMVKQENLRKEREDTLLNNILSTQKEETKEETKEDVKDELKDWTI